MTSIAEAAPESGARFKRARRPEEVSIRRETLLNAAAELFDEGGPTGAGLNAIAARAGFTKSNVYRYFESREEVLLCLYLAEFEAFLPRFEIAVAMCPDSNTAMIARATVDTLLDHPRLIRLMAILSSVIEHNISVETAADLKRETNIQHMRIAFTLHDKLPGTTMEDCAWVAGMIQVVVAGLWPAAHPSPVATQILATPEFMHLRPEFERDIERSVLALLRSIDSRWLPADAVLRPV